MTEHGLRVTPPSIDHRRVAPGDRVLWRGEPAVVVRGHDGRHTAVIRPEAPGSALRFVQVAELESLP